MDKKFSYLQLSDLHIFESTDWNIMQRKYKQLLKHNIKFIVITGDLHQYGQNYDATKIFLGNLLKIFNLTKKDLFLVPGNHDAKEYDLKSSDVDYIRTHIDENQDCYIQYWNEKRLLQSFTEYKGFIENFYGKDKIYDDPCQVSLQTWNDTIDIIHLNSAMICDGDNSKKQIVDIKKLSNLINKRNFQYPSIIICHHDFNSLFSSHQNTLRRLMTDFNIGAYLCGDLHKMGLDATLKYNLNRQIPCIISGKAVPETGDSYSDLGCIVYEVNIANQQSETTVYPYVWSKVRKRFEESHMFDDDDGNKYVYTSLMDDGNNGDICQFEQKEEINDLNPLSIWLTDAEDAEGGQTRFATYTETNKIKKFIAEDSSKWGISAVKGVGKTFALQIKKIKLSKQYLSLPIGIKPSKDNNWGVDSIVFDSMGDLKKLKDFNNIIKMWKYSFVCYIFNQCLHMVNNTEPQKKSVLILKQYIEEAYKTSRISPTTYELCFNIEYRNLNSFIKGILEDDNWVDIITNDWRVLSLSYNKLSEIIKQKRKKHIAIFVDKVDQSIKQTAAEMPSDCINCFKSDYFNKCINPKKSIDYCATANECNSQCCFGCELFESPYSNVNLRIHDNGKYEHVNLWQYIQLGLVCAVDQIKINFSGLIKIFYTIRQEAFACEPDKLGEHQRKIMALTEELYYTRDEQEAIFLDCIKNQDDIYLYDCSLKNTSRKEEAFVGVNKLCHPYVGSDESVFDSIYRHSFDRARDIQDYCGKITKNLSQIKRCSNFYERGEKVKRLIEDRAAMLVYNNTQSKYSSNDSYYIEKMKFLPNYWCNTSNFEKFILQIDRNLLFMDDLIPICRNLNNITNECNGKCESSHCKRHPFSVMYRLGLLGLIRINRNSDITEKQAFIHSREVTYIKEMDCLRPNSQVMYILHPALTKCIERLKKKHIMHFNGFILGKDVRVDKSILEKIFYDRNNMTKRDFEKKYYGK